MSADGPYALARVGAHQVALLKDGAQTYPAMLAAIAAAKSSICLETYIFRDDTTGRRFGEALMDRARAGVQVNLMYDFWGSQVSEPYLDELRAAGVRVVVYRPPWLAGRLGNLFKWMSRRNHRKSLVVDGTVGFLGGLNIADDYAPVGDGGQGWRDTHLRVEGPSVTHLERLFLETWVKNGGPPVDTSRYARSVQPMGDQVRVVGNALADERRYIRREYVNAFRRAQSRILLTHAYFLPPLRVLRALRQAARRGVEVVVILAATTDVRLVLLGARGLYPKLLRSGIRVFEWEGRRVLHAKTAVVDGEWTTVGSANLDAMSLRLNLEVNAVVRDHAFAAALERMFREDLQACHEVTMEEVKNRSIWERLASWAAYQLRHWL